uniref:Uncharacterized protein n=1 Tax=Clytia hemisphaerica TaxID=252671 RepID=A0A7M5XLX1_9CNID
QELESYGIETLVLEADTVRTRRKANHIMTYGSDAALDFSDGHTDLDWDFASFINGLSAEDRASKSERNEVAKLLNKKFSSLKTSRKRVPYKRICNGSVQVVGLPEGFILRKPAACTKQELEVIKDNMESISFIVRRGDPAKAYSVRTVEVSVGTDDAEVSVGSDFVETSETFSNMESMIDSISENIPEAPASTDPVETSTSVDPAETSTLVDPAETKTETRKRKKSKPSEAALKTSETASKSSKTKKKRSRCYPLDSMYENVGLDEELPNSSTLTVTKRVVLEMAK